MNTSKHATDEVKAIVADVRAIIDEVGKPVDEQVFSYYVRAENLLRITLVCDGLDRKAINANFWRCHMYQGAMTSWATEYHMDVMINRYWIEKDLVAKSRMAK